MSLRSRVHVAASAAATTAHRDQAIVVLVHGAMDRSASFGRAVRLLDDLPLVRYDRRGYGHSTDIGIGDLEAHVADLIDVLGGRPSVVVGHSIGGVFALVAAQQQPDLILSVGTWEAPMPWAPWWPASSAGGAALGAASQAVPDDGAAGDAAERFMRRMIGDDRWNRLPPATRLARRVEGRALLADLRSLQRDGPPYDAGSLVPSVLAGYGTASAPHHQRASEELAKAVADGELMAVEGAEHGVHLSHPRDFAAFVRRAAARGPAA